VKGTEVTHLSLGQRQRWIAAERCQHIGSDLELVGGEGVETSKTKLSLSQDDFRLQRSGCLLQLSDEGFRCFGDECTHRLEVLHDLLHGSVETRVRLYLQSFVALFPPGNNCQLCSGCLGPVRKSGRRAVTSKGCNFAKHFR
jgi:hypothetical protein